MESDNSLRNGTVTQPSGRGGVSAGRHGAAAGLAVYAGPAQSACGDEIEIQIWRSVDEIDQDAWNSLRDADDLFMDLRLLRVVQTSMSRDASFRYVLFRDSRGTPLAATCVCTYTVDSALLAEEGLMRKVACALRSISPALVQYRILFCGMPFSGGQSHLRFAPDADRRSILKSLDDLLRAVAREDRAHCIVFKEFSADELPAIEAIGGLGYRRADSLPMNEMVSSITTFDEYLTELPHRKRHEIRKSMKKAAAAGLQVLVTSDRAQVERLFTASVHQMYTAVVGKAKTKLELLPVEFFLEMVRQLPGNCEFQFALHNGDVVGFGMCLFNETTYHPLFMGIDYNRNREFDLYFNLMFQALACSMARGKTCVHLGQDADQFKRTKLGATQSPRYFYIKGASVVMDWIVGLLFKQLFPPRPLLDPTCEPADPLPAPVRRSA